MLKQLEHWTEELSGRKAGKTWKRIEVISNYAVQDGSSFFKSVDETLVCDHSNESYYAVLSCGTVYYAVQEGSNFQVCG